MLPGNLDHAPEIQLHSSLGQISTVICGAEEGESKKDSHFLARKRTCLSISSKNIPPEINGLKYYGLERLGQGCAKLRTNLFLFGGGHKGYIVLVLHSFALVSHNQN